MNKIRVGITMGDPSGIGPAIILKAVKKLHGFFEFTVIGDEWVFEQLRRVSFSCGFVDLNNVGRRNFSFGQIKAEYGRASVEYLDKALELIKNKQIDCLVTCPVSKEAINKAGIGFPGHTEYLAKKAHTKNFAMMLLNKYLKFSLVTWHIPLKSVPGEIKKEKLYKTINLTYNSLKELFSIKEPKIVICGLNPHASDNGLFGTEENRIIKPLIKKLKNKIKYIDGPKSADVAILQLKEKKYDCAIVMYHDQALIPLKVLDPSTGVNFTLGLPFIRTSPLHGTAFDIAKDYPACDPSSLIQSIRLAGLCALNQKNN